MLGYGLLIELDCEEVVVGLITCGGDLVVLGPDSSAAVRMAVVHYLMEGEEQKEVLEAIDDKEKENELDGEVEERVTQRAHETWR